MSPGSPSRAPRARSPDARPPTSRAPGRRSSAASARRPSGTSRASSSRRPTTSSRARPRASSSLDQLQAFCREWAHRQPRLRTLEEPDALRRAEDRLDGRGGGSGAGRPGEDRRGDLQPAARPHPARNRRDAPLRAPHPADAIDHRGRAAERTTPTTRAGSTACRRRRSATRARLDRGGGPPGPRRLPLLRRASPAPTGTSSSPTRMPTSAYLATHGYGPHP